MLKTQKRYPLLEKNRVHRAFRRHSQYSRVLIRFTHQKREDIGEEIDMVLDTIIVNYR